MSLLLVIEIVLDSYGLHQSYTNVFSMRRKNFPKSTTYKFLILNAFINMFIYMVKSILTMWLLNDSSESFCSFFIIGMYLAEVLNLSLLFGVSFIRLISVVKKKIFINYNSLDDAVWKVLTPILLAIASACVMGSHTIIKEESQKQVRK